MQAQPISIERAKTHQLFYFVANALVYREDDHRCLILKRSEREKVHPGRWTTPGGKLEWGDLDIEHPSRMNGDVRDYERAIDELIVREVREEAGVEVSGPLQFIGQNVFIRPDGVPVVLVKFAVRYAAGEVILEEGSFTDYAWVNQTEIKKYACIDGVPEEVAATIALFTGAGGQHRL
jgi:8-oxo-dGTP pyrophosphatase MutT (NUDIX family)